MHNKSTLHNKLLHFLPNSKKENCFMENGNTKICLNKEEHKDDIKKIDDIYEKLPDINKLDTDELWIKENNIDIKNEMRPNNISNNIFKFKLNYESEKNSSKALSSNFSVSLMSKGELSKDYYNSSIKYTKITGAFIPNCF